MDTFLAKIVIEKLNDFGKTVKGIESYLINAVSYTDAEASFFQHMEGYSNRFEKLRISRINLSQLLKDTEGDFWYIAKVAFFTTDDGDAKTKRIIVRVALKADDIDNASSVIKKEMIGSMADWRIIEIKETEIVEYIDNSDADVSEDSEEL